MLRTLTDPAGGEKMAESRYRLSQNVVVAEQ